MIRDRARDTKRSVGSHQEMMGALGRASGWSRGGSRALASYDKNDSEHFVPGKGHVANPGSSSISKRYQGTKGIALSSQKE